MGKIVTVVALGLVLTGSAVLADSFLDGKEDFAVLGHTGLRYVVDGSWPTLVENLDGDPQNSYPWGMGWDPNTGTLWVGTVRNLLCLLSGGGFGGGGDCPEPDPGSAFALPRYPQDAAQIWGFSAAGVGGIHGSWALKYQSGITPWQFLLDLSGATDHDVPRTFGYRNVLVADVSGDVPDLGPLVYFGSLGLPGGVFWWDEAGNTLQETSTTGLPGVAILDLIGGTVNLGFRALEFFEGHVCTFPSASLTDTDTTDFPQVFCSDDPIDGSWEAWSEEGWGDSDVIGSFDAEVVDNTGDGVADYLCFSSYDRTKGSTIYCTDGTGCDVDVAPPAGVMDCDWDPTGPGTSPVPLVAHSMGRPDLYLGDEGGGPSVNAAGFGMGVYDADGDGKDDFLYFGMADAAGGPNANNFFAEMGRLDFRTDLAGPVLGGPSQLAPNPDFLKWDFMAGLPRMTGDCATDSGSTDVGPFPLSRQKACTLVDLPSFFGGPTGSTCVCKPLSGRGLGLADSAYGFGTSSYIWRFLQHQGDLFVGNLHSGFGGGFGGNPSGADLYKSADGITFERIVDDGFGNGGNYGVRTMATTDPTPHLPEPTGPAQLGIGDSPGLFVGLANPFGDVNDVENGMEVYLGTIEPEFPPVADAGPTQLLFDDEAYPDVGDGGVSATLDGSGSFDPFGGAITAYEWFGASACTGGAAGGDADTTATTAVDLTITTGPLTPPYYDTFSYSLEVEDNFGPPQTDCDDTTVLATQNFPPFVELATSPPSILEPQGFGGARLRLRLVDFDGNGTEPFALSIHCGDVEEDATPTPGPEPRCVKFIDDELVLANPSLESDESAADFTVGVTFVPGSDSSPDIFVTAFDSLLCPTGSEPLCGVFRDDDRMDVVLQSFTDTPAVNDAPACIGGEYAVLKNGGPLIIDPEADGLCADPDGDTPLAYVAGDVDADHGSVIFASISYTPDADYVGPDLFSYRAEDGEPLASNQVGIAVRVIDCTLPTDSPIVHVDVVGDTVGDTTDDHREACLSIYTDTTTIDSDVAVTFLAGESIAIGNGFTVSTGADFTATIDDSVFDDGS